MILSGRTLTDLPFMQESLKVQIDKVKEQDINARIMKNENIFSNILYYKLRSIVDKNNIPGTVSKLTEFLDVSSALANRIIKNIGNYNSFTGFINTLKTKQYTYSRICRSLLHIILDIRKDSFNITFPLSAQDSLNACQITPYARLLGMDKSKSSILKNIKNNILITKTASSAFFAASVESLKSISTLPAWNSIGISPLKSPKSGDIYGLSGSFAPIYSPL